MDVIRWVNEEREKSRLSKAWNVSMVVAAEEGLKAINARVMNAGETE